VAAFFCEQIGRLGALSFSHPQRSIQLNSPSGDPSAL
jgi:hypothetical protein